MRHLPRAARACFIGLFTAAVSAPAFSSNVSLTLDLLAPDASDVPCSGDVCPSDINLPGLGSVIGSTDWTYAQGQGTPTNFVSTFTLDNAVTGPIVCNEAVGNANSYTLGPSSGSRFTATYSNVAAGSLLASDLSFEFDAGASNGANIVDTGSLTIDAGVYGVTASNGSGSQVACYQINQLGDTTPVLANSSASGDRVFYNRFEGGHLNEPWISVQTTSAFASGSTLGYVVQIHNANLANNWHLSFGYDHDFNPAVNGSNANNWYVLTTANSPQPGPVLLTGSPPTGSFSSAYIVNTATDLQAATNSVYLFVQMTASGNFKTAWPTLPLSFYPATASIFAPPGTYVQKVDDKSGVAGRANVPTQNIGNIVCANDPAVNSCTLYDQDGNASPLNYSNTISSGALTVDPVAYVVDTVDAGSTPTGTTLPGTQTTLGAPSNISCNDPNGILNGSASFGASSGAAGARALSVTFKQSGATFVPGTASCTATFTSNGLSSTQSFNITMQALTVTHFAVTSGPVAEAGTPTSFTVTAQDGANNTVTTYSGTVAFSSSDHGASTVLPASSPLINGVGVFNATLTTAGSQTITAKDGAIQGSTDPIIVAPSVADHIQISMLGSADHGVATGANVTVVDAYGNEATAYIGTLHYTSTDNAASLPVDGLLAHGSHGAISVTFNTPGNQTVSANDTLVTGISGTSNPVTVN